MTRFFIPGVEPDEAEEVYAVFAASVHRPVPPIDQRIEAITFTSDGARWIAHVGQQLHGERVDKRRRQGKTVEVRTPVHDRATVQAIFAGVPYIVFTNAGLDNTRSAFVNPFMAGGGGPTAFFKRD